MQTTKHFVLRNTLLIILLSICFSINKSQAQTYKMDFEPKGKIIRFDHDSMAFLTDATSIIEFYSDKDKIGNPFYAKRIINYIKKRVKETNSDTITISGEKIMFNDEYNVESMNEWTIIFTLTDLLKEKKLKIYDKNNKLVKTIKAKEVGSKKEGLIFRNYIDKETKELILVEFLYVAEDIFKIKDK